MKRMRKISVLVLALTVFSCKKDEKVTPATPKCDCFEEHQVWNPNYGWTLDYKTDTIQRNCSDELSDWKWENPEHTRRYIINCN